MMARLGDIATYVNGYAFKPSDWSDTGLPIIRIQDLTGNSYQANRYNGEYDKKYEVNSGDVLISWSASLGVYLWGGEKALLNQHIFKVVFDKAEVNKNFFVYQVQNILENAASQAHGATMKHLTKPVFAALPFNLPSMGEQQHIAAVLDRLYDLISLRKQQLAKLDELVKARFVEMFGDTKKEHSWPQATIKELSTDIRTGPFGSALHHDEFVDQGVFVLGIDNAVENKFSYNRMRYITEEKYEQLKRYTVKPGDVIITIMGTVGRSAVIPENMPRAINTKHLACITLDKSRTNPYFLSYAFQIHPAIQRQLKAQTKGAIMDGLNLTIIKGLSFALPPIEIQNLFVDFYMQTEKTRLKIQQGLDKLEVLKKSLMQEYFG